MRSVEAGLVDIVREFILADELLRRMLARQRSGELRFEEVQELVGDSEASVLFRLKERCHALFRAGVGDDPAMIRGALFDLAVGSLFHEAMKLRENFYQLVVYAPKVRALRAEAGPEAGRLFQEFEKILAAAEARFEEALQETEVLLEQTREQFRVLLVAHRGNGLVARYLLENASLVEQVLREGLDELFARTYGQEVEGYALAARSYLESGFFAEAQKALAEAMARDPECEQFGRLAAYAEGMRAYLDGRYGDAVCSLERWLGGTPGPADAVFLELAHAAVSRLGQLVEGSAQEDVAESAATLARGLAERLDGARAAAGA